MALDTICLGENQALLHISRKAARIEQQHTAIYMHTLERARERDTELSDLRRHARTHTLYVLLLYTWRT